MRIEPFHFATATRDQHGAWNTFSNRLRAERDPDDPPLSLEESIVRVTTIPSHVEVHAWAAWLSEEIVAQCQLRFQLVEHNRHVANALVAVLPEHRRQGLARRLLTPMVDVARREHRHLLVGQTSSTIPAGEAFMRRLGAEMGLAIHVNQLDVRELNRDLIRRWQERAAERASGFELLLWDGGVPEEHLQAFVDLVDAMNLGPRGTLRIEDQRTTPGRMRTQARTERERGDQWWRYVAQERDSSALAGYTEVIWHPEPLAPVATG